MDKCEFLEISCKCKFYAPKNYLAHLKHEIIQCNHFRAVSLEMLVEVAPVSTETLKEKL